MGPQRPSGPQGSVPRWTSSNPALATSDEAFTLPAQLEAHPQGNILVLEINGCPGSFSLKCLRQFVSGVGGTLVSLQAYEDFRSMRAQIVYPDATTAAMAAEDLHGSTIPLKRSPVYCAEKVKLGAFDAAWHEPEPTWSIPADRPGEMSKEDVATGAWSACPERGLEKAHLCEAFSRLKLPTKGLSLPDSSIAPESYAAATKEIERLVALLEADEIASVEFESKMQAEEDELRRLLDEAQDVLELALGNI